MNFPNNVFAHKKSLSWVNTDLGATIRYIASSGATAAWPSANRAYYIPFTLRVPYVVSGFFCVNNTVSGNFDMGVYDVSGKKIISTGSTAQAGASTVQTKSVTDTILGPGIYYFAMACNGTTGQYRTSGVGNNFNASFLGIYQQASAFALPATATFATANASLFLPVFGVYTNY